MRLKGGLGANIKKEDHPDQWRNVNYFKENYANANPTRQKDIYLYIGSDEMVAWIGFSAEKGKPMYSVAYPIPLHQNHIAFIEECKTSFLRCNDWAWKQIKTLQDWESKLKKREEKT